MVTWQLLKFTYPNLGNLYKFYSLNHGKSFFFFFELLKTLKYMASLHYYLSGGNAFSSVANKCLVGAEQREQLNAAQWVEFAKSYVKPAWVFANPALVEAWALDRSRTAARH